MALWKKQKLSSSEETIQVIVREGSPGRTSDTMRGRIYETRWSI